MITIKLPKPFTGVRAGVTFVEGVGKTPRLSPNAHRYLASIGAKVTEPRRRAVKPAPAPEGE